jgi:hypothetical protein
LGFKPHNYGKFPIMLAKEDLKLSYALLLATAGTKIEPLTLLNFTG